MSMCSERYAEETPFGFWKYQLPPTSSDASKQVCGTPKSSSALHDVSPLTPAPMTQTLGGAEVMRQCYWGGPAGGALATGGPLVGDARGATHHQRSARLRDRALELAAFAAVFLVPVEREPLDRDARGRRPRVERLVVVLVGGHIGFFARRHFFA